jgi:hypothetical protein
MSRIDKILDPPFFAALDEANRAGIILGPDWQDAQWNKFLMLMNTRGWSPVENGTGSWLDVAPWKSDRSVVGLYKRTPHTGASPLGQRAYDEALGALLRSYAR